MAKAKFGLNDILNAKSRAFFTRRAGAAHGNCKGKRRVSDSGRA